MTRTALRLGLSICLAMFVAGWEPVGAGTLGSEVDRVAGEPETTSTTVVDVDSREDAEGDDDSFDFDVVLEGLGWFGWVVGIVSGWLQYRSYRSQKRNEQGYEELLEQAARRRRRRLRQEDLDAIEQDISRAKEELSRDVPLQAKRIFLEERQQSLEAQLSSVYGTYEDTVDELSRTSSAIGPRLSDHIRNAIEDSIRPNFLEAERRRRSAMWTVAGGLLLLVTISSIPLLAFLVQDILDLTGVDLVAEEVVLYVLLLATCCVIGALWGSSRRRRSMSRTIAVILTAAGIALLVVTIWLVEVGHPSGVSNLTSIASLVAFGGLASELARRRRWLADSPED